MLRRVRLSKAFPRLRLTSPPGPLSILERGRHWLGTKECLRGPPKITESASEAKGGTVTDTQVYDITVIGGGPTGLFALFYAGMRGMSAKVLDGFDELGGQVTALYPEKYIYDMPGFKEVFGKDLVTEMCLQGLQYGAAVALGCRAETLERDECGWRIGLANGDQHLSRTVLITAGAGSFSPIKPPLEGMEQWVGKGIHYAVKEKEVFRDRRLLILGGGDSAIDWCLNLHPIAREVTLIHRRDGFRAHEESVNQLWNTPVDVMCFWQLMGIHGNDRIEAARVFFSKPPPKGAPPGTPKEPRQERLLAVDDILCCFGFKADLGPIKNWGLALGERDRSILVNTKMETNLPGVYAAGDVAGYDGKLGLIACGVGEAALAVNHAKKAIDPKAALFEHSSEMSETKEQVRQWDSREVAERRPPNLLAAVD